MSAIRQLLHRLRALFRKEKLDRDMAEEMRFHLAQRAAEHVDDGMAPDEARFAAQRKFGGIEQIKERARGQRGWLWLEQFAQDIRYAGRQLQRDPGFAATSVAILALGIGATTAIFSVVHGMILKPLPYGQSGQLVQVFETPKPGSLNTVSPGVFFDFRTQSTLFEGFAAFINASANFNDAGPPERINGLQMTANALQLMRARPVLGRIFAPDEDQPGKANVIVLTHQLWQRRYGGDPGIIGRTVSIDAERHTVIGVLPRGFLPQERSEFVVPLTRVHEPQFRENRGGHWLRVYARLNPGVTIEQGRAEIVAIVERQKPLYDAWKRDWSATALALEEQLARDFKPALLVLLGAVALVLLIACANVASLLLAKASARRKEIALRAALGAGRGRILRQLLAESVLLAGLGGVAGLALATWSVQVLREVMLGMNLPRAHEAAIDSRMLVVTLAIALLTGIAFGLAPALQASRTDVNDALKDAARGSGAGGSRARGGLIVAEVALALMLLVGAGLLLHSFSRLIRVSPGFSPEHALTLQLSVPEKKFPDNARSAEFFGEIAERVAALPGVEAAGLAASVPAGGRMSNSFFRIAGRENHPSPGYDCDYEPCTPDYFRALGVPLQRGRSFEARDRGSEHRVAIINEAMAREYFPGEDPIGRVLVQDDFQWEIVGVVGNVRMRGLTHRARPTVYRVESPFDPWRTATLVVRSRPGLAPGALVKSVREAIAAIDPTQPVANVRTLNAVVAASVGQRRLTLVLLGLFAGAALLLAAIGLYAVIAYAVTQRTREFGIRLALGADRSAVLGLVLRQGLKLVALGMAFGLIGAFSLTRVLSNLLYEIKPTDPLTFAGVSVVLLLVALFASWLPARRAAKVDPMVALRAE